MKRLKFGCICELAEVMSNYVETNTSENEYPIVAAYGDYEVAKELIETLIKFGNSIGAILELEDYEMSHYNKEYCVYLTEDGITCEKCYHEKRYYNGGGDISFVHEDCNSKLLNYIDSEIIYEFGIGEYEDDSDECDCDECCECCGCENNNELEIESDGDMYGFSVNRADDNGSSYYSFFSTDMNLVECMANLFR